MRPKWAMAAAVLPTDRTVIPSSHGALFKAMCRVGVKIATRCPPHHSPHSSAAHCVCFYSCKASWGCIKYDCQVGVQDIEQTNKQTKKGYDISISIHPLAGTFRHPEDA